MNELIFADREHAGQLLAGALRKYADRPDVIVLGLPRGGVPVAYEVAKRLHVPLDVMVVRKLGLPGWEELHRREIAFRGHTGAPDVKGKTVILIDDGIATGFTIRAAVQALHQQEPARIVIAVPTLQLRSPATSWGTPPNLNRRRHVRSTLDCYSLL